MATKIASWRWRSSAKLGPVAADVAGEVEVDAAVAQMARAPLDDRLLQLEAGDAVDQQAADPVVAVVDVDLLALPAQLLGAGEAGRAGADDADRLRPARAAAGPA